MSQVPSVRAVSEYLQTLQAGQRVWFWCSPDVDGDHPPILIRSFADDASMKKIREDAEHIPLVLGGLQCIGAGHLGEDGVFQLGGPLVEASMLERVAAWVAANVGEHPGLALLSGVRFLNVKRGQVAATYHDDALWASVPRPILPGTMDHTAVVWAGLQPGERAWFWMVERGPAGEPFLALQPQSPDPSGEAFAAQVRAILLRSPEQHGTSIRGVLQQRADWPALSTTDDIDGWKPLVTALSGSRPALLSLRSARMVLLVDGAVHRVEALEGATSAPAPGLLVDDIGAKAAWFWMGDTAKGTTLLLGKDPEQLNGQAPDGARGVVLGQVRRSSKGWLEFRSDTNDTKFIHRLAGWYKQNRAQDGVSSLPGARFIVHDGSQTLARYKDDGAWS